MCDKNNFLEKNDERYLPEEEFSDDEIPPEDEDEFKKEPSPPLKKHAPEQNSKVATFKTSLTKISVGE
jgi:hypothetical protein